MLIADSLTPNTDLAPIDPSKADFETIRRSLIPTEECRETLRIILKQLSMFPTPQPSGYLFSGEPGTGKTHLLRYLCGMLENPVDPAWQSLFVECTGTENSVHPPKSLLFAVPADPSVELASFLIEKLGQSTAGQDVETFCRPDISQEEFTARMLVSGSELSASAVGMVILDDISPRLDRLTNTEGLEQEVRLYTTLMEVLSGSGILVLLVVEDRHLDAREGVFRQALALDVLNKAAGRIRLSRKNASAVITRTFAAKGEAQKAALRDVLQVLRKRLPCLDVRTATFVDLYPIHPYVFAAMFEVPRILRGFSPLRFVREVIDDSLRRPVETPVTIDLLFDYILPQLQSIRDFNAVLASFHDARTKGIPCLKALGQDKAERMLKAITLWTLIKREPASVRFLANALLLYDESELLPSYSLVAGLLLEMEQIREFHLLVEGEKQDRGYRILGEEGRIFSSPARNPWEKEEFRLRFPIVLLDWFQKEMPSWTIDLSPHYQRKSQSFAAPLPEGDSGLRGFVCFKSPFEAPWSGQDIAALNAAGHMWILLILNPFERFFEFDALIRKIAASSHRILVWRPDSPHAGELDQLHLAVPRYPMPWETTTQGSTDRLKIQGSVRKILEGLYIRRGQFITSGEQWLVGDDTEGRSPKQYLASCLASIARISKDDQPVQKAAPAEILDSTHMHQNALHWAALLAGQDELRTVDPSTAETRLLEWWNSSFEMDVNILLDKLRPLPDELLTTRFRTEIITFELSLGLIKPILERLRSRDIPFIDAMTLVATHFRRDVGRLLHWRRMLEELAGFLRWSAAFDHARDYTCGAFPTGQQQVDHIRGQLLQTIDQPHILLNAGERERFDRLFLEFKRAYADYYNSMHEDALQMVGNQDRIQAKLDGVALRNLELLSKLPFVNRACINRVRIMARWAQRNQCSFPVRDILERYPRCYCNFNPCSSLHLIGSIDRINGTIAEGIEQFRAILLKNKRILFEELSARWLDKRISRQIVTLMTGGPMASLSPQAVEALGKIMQKHPIDFMAAIRSRTPGRARKEDR